jgi:hypothetical protein
MIHLAIKYKMVIVHVYVKKNSQRVCIYIYIYIYIHIYVYIYVYIYIYVYCIILDYIGIHAKIHAKTSCQFVTFRWQFGGVWIPRNSCDRSGKTQRSQMFRIRNPLVKLHNL